MYDQIALFAQILMMAALAAWLTTGVWDNILHPANNEAFTAEVMGMARMQAAFPQAFARVSHRAITNRRTQRAAFVLVVVAELVATFALWLGVALLCASGFGLATPQTALAMALLGATLFTSIWAGFLVVGNYFCYWFCHEWGQNTHFQMLLWGLATMIFLVAV